MRFVIPAVLVVGLCLTPAAFAQKDKGAPMPSGSLFFTMKGQPFAMEKLFPGVQGALLLTDAQKKDLHEAWSNTLGSEEVRTAGQTLKGNPNADAAAKEAAKKTIQDAREKLQKEVGNVLTREQKEVIEKLQATADEAREAAHEKLSAELTAAKGDKEKMDQLQKQLRDEAVAEFTKRIVNRLSEKQKEGLEKAAKEQKAAEANNNNKSK